MVFVVHSVTWKALCKPVPCCRHKQQLQETLSCLSLMRAGTSPVLCRVRLASLHSWEKEIFVYCAGSRGQAAHRSVVHCYTSAAAWSGPPHHVVGLPGALTPNWSFLPMDLEFRFGLLHKGALGTWGCATVHSPNAETIGQLLGDHWAWCLGWLCPLFLLSSLLLSGADGDTLGAAKKGSVSWKEQGLHSSPHCRIFQWP